MKNIFNPSIPKLSITVIKKHETRRPSFATMYRQLQLADPVAAEWLRDATEQIAPANPYEKQKYAHLVLSYHRMLQDQLLHKG